LWNVQLAINIPVHIVPQLFMSVVVIITPFCIMFSLNSFLAVIVICPVFLFVLLSLVFGKRMESVQKLFLETNASMYSFLKENLSIIPLIKVFNLEKWSQKRFNNEMDNYYTTSINFTKTTSLNSSTSSLIMGIPIILFIVFGGSMVINNSLSLGTFTAFMSYTSIFFSPISQLSTLWTSYKSSLPALDRIKEIFDMKIENEGKELVLVNGEIVLEDVGFSYGDRPILEGFNATFHKGLNYIVGDNGTGKTTILKLICSLYPLDKGNILIDGQKISEIKKEDLMKNISIIFSDPYIFDASIYENISIGNLNAPMEEVVRVAKLVKIHEFIINTSNGYDTRVGEDGVLLSSGEKQKIALPRALLKNLPILLLDEVTKSIDSESRKSINETIHKIKNNKTIIIITHNKQEIKHQKNTIQI
jgi:ATP-binding cassette subfamily B protein/subfamily B ATP-binding cassette protein MsbA